MPDNDGLSPETPIEWLPPLSPAAIPPGTWRTAQLTSPDQPALDVHAVDQAARTLLDLVTHGEVSYRGDDASDAYLITAAVLRCYLAECDEHST